MARTITRFPVNAKDVTISTLRSSVISKVLDYESAASDNGSRPQKTYRKTGLPLYRIDVELVINRRELDDQGEPIEDAETITLKIAAESEPVLKAKKDYRIGDGALIAVVYQPEGQTRPAVSYTLVGTLVPETHAGHDGK